MEGSAFSIEVPIAPEMADAEGAANAPADAPPAPFRGTLLVIEDDSFVREGFEALLRATGVRTVLAATGNEALALIAEKGVRPDAVVSDYNLPGPMNGTAAVAALRAALGSTIPAIILTGDTRSHVIDAITRHDVVVAIKPLRAEEFERLLTGLQVSSLAHPD